MASIEFVQKRIAGKEKELEKLNRKLERIRKVEAQNWEDPNPYYYSERDLRITLKDIEEVQTALSKYKEQLTTEQEKEASRNVPVIVEFLNDWKDQVTDFYKKGFEDYYAEKQMVKDLYDKLENKYFYEAKDADQIAYVAAKETFHRNCYGFYKEEEFTNRWGKQDTRKVKVKDGKYEWLNPYIGEVDINGALGRLSKDLNQEWNRKYDFIIERTNYIVGQITDASNLYIGNKHDLNGYIIGTKGTAKVQTIGAGGHSVQRFHFRTLINEM